MDQIVSENGLLRTRKCFVRIIKKKYYNSSNEEKKINFAGVKIFI